MATESERDAALRVLRADYYDDVRSCAQDIYDDAKERAAAGETGLDEWIGDRLHETCDGHARVIYTGLAIETLLFSDNESQYVDEYGTDGVCSDGVVNWSALAFAAFQTDVREQLESLGIEWGDDRLGFDEPDDDATDDE